MKNENEDKCPICLKNLQNPKKSIEILEICKHQYHEECINKWEKMSNKCPMCKRNI